MPNRTPTPPPPVDKSKYLSVVHPYPLNADLELHADQSALALWLACCTGKDVLLAMFYNPSSPEMVVIEVDHEFDRFPELLGLHVWSEFLTEPTSEQMDKSSMVFYSTYNTTRLAKGGWKRVNIEEHWFQGWTPNNSIIRYPYPKPSHCDGSSSSEAKSGVPVCCLLLQQYSPVQPSPPAPPVGSADSKRAAASDSSKSTKPLSTVSAASATGSDAGQRPSTGPATRQSSRSSVSSSVRTGAGPSTPSMPEVADGFPTYANTEWADPIAMAQAKEGGKKKSRSARKGGNKARNAKAQVQAVQANVLEAALDVALPPIGPSSS